MAQIRQTLTRDPNLLFQEAVALHRAGELDRARTIYRYLGENLPPNAVVLEAWGAAESEAGNSAEGVRLLDESLKLSPANARAHNNRGKALTELKRPEEALSSFETAVHLRPDYAEAWLNRGVSLLDLDRPTEAVESFDRAIRLRPSDAAAYFQRGAALIELERWNEALSSCRRAVELGPEDAGAHCNMATVLRRLLRLDEALASYDRAIGLRPDLSEAYSGRGNVLLDLGRPGEALASHDRAIRLRPDYAEAHLNRGVALRDLRRPTEALACYDRAIQLKPDYAEALLNKATVLLQLGEMSEGWRLYEWRLRTASGRKPRHFSQPPWVGDEPVAGKTVLIHSEQGLGDVIQCCRYVPRLARLRARVVLQVPQSLVALMRTLRCECVVVPEGELLPQFDIQCPIMSLPLAFRTSLQTIPSEVPYLYCDRERSARWGQKLGPANALRVGLVWSTGHDERRKGNAEQKRRDIPLAALESLRIDGVEFYSLQIGPAAVEQLRSLESSGWNGPHIIDHTGEITDFADTAALIDNLDLVISVCTSVAHLAGAMGKTTWVLLQFSADWRWLLDRSDSPWYPSLTLLRQSSIDQWSDVVVEVRERLIALADATQSAQHRSRAGD